MTFAATVERLIESEAAYMRATWSNAGERLAAVHAARDAVAAHPDNRRAA